MGLFFPTFVPGDYITYVLYLAYPANLREVKARFEKVHYRFNEVSEVPTGQKSSVILTWRVGDRSGDWSQAGWEEQLAPDPRIEGTQARFKEKLEGTRTRVVVLSGVVNESVTPGTYWLETLTAETYLKKQLTIDLNKDIKLELGKRKKLRNLNATMFAVVDEPDISVLPDSAVLPLTGFHLPEGHPDRLQ
jgi:hypothetical protein